ncbi:MAG TPA: hypothetical protein VFQ28_06510 [Gaiella sp.]|nr:hypothetical protein [Gaiella sp.]
MIVPRWEWRTFGDELGDAESRLEALTPTEVEDGDEVYVLSTRDAGSVKVRHGQLDVKRLEQVEDGLQQWRPILKADFPVEASAVAALLEALGASVPLARDAYSLDELVDEVAGGAPDLFALPVHKHRRHYVLDGCLAELTDVRAGSGSTRTIAVEHEDAALVRATVESLGLWSRPNVSVPRGLRALAGFEARRYAVVDVGSNSVKVHLAEQAADGTWRVLADRSEVTRLGDGLHDTGELHAEPMRRTADAVVAAVEGARREGAEGIAAVGTAALRSARNSEALLDDVEERCGVRIEVIDGEEEARLSYVAAMAGLGPVDGSVVVFETGGGSTQFTFGHGERVEGHWSVDVGALRLTDRFGLERAVGTEVVADALRWIGDELTPLDDRETPDVLVGLGGAVTNLAAVRHGLAEYDREVVHGTELTVAELDELIERFRTRSAEERRGITGLQPKRAEVILAGACVVRAVLAELRRDSFTVSDRGLRHRLLVERFGEAS